MRRSAPLALLVIAVVAVVVIVVAGGKEPYRVTFLLDNAAGLRDGSEVLTGDVRIGEVRLSLTEDDSVAAELEIDRDKGPIGKDARAYIASVNLLGQKRLELERGSADDPAPDGHRFARGRATTSTDLDQVLDVLEPGTRARLGVLINELGTAVTGRRTDLRQLLGALPETVREGTWLLQAVSADTQALRQAVTRTDAFLTDVHRKRRELTELVDTVGQASETVRTKRAELAATLDRAPGTLTQLQRFLGQLEQTTGPLGPAARAIRQTARPLRQTLAELPAFTAAADPTLELAVRVAPDLTRLAGGATPTLRRTVPAAQDLARLATTLEPVSKALDGSVDNIIGIVDNWSRAIQFRDGLSHVFRGEAAMSPQTATNLLKRFAPEPARKKRKREAAKAPAVAPPAAERLPRVPALPKPLDRIKVPDVGGITKDVLKGVDGLLRPKSEAPQESGPDSIRSLLDFLLR